MRGGGYTFKLASVQGDQNNLQICAWQYRKGFEVDVIYCLFTNNFLCRNYSFQGFLKFQGYTNCGYLKNSPLKIMGL